MKQFLSFVFLCSLTLIACNTDQCVDVNCLNDGICNDGNCECPVGFTGDNCELAIDPCQTVSCNLNGVCVDGQCVCDEGYEGENCLTLSTRKFTGSYNVEETCGNFYKVYVLHIMNQETSSITEVKLVNLYDAGYYVVGYVSGNSLTIPSQYLGDPSTSISGAGTMVGINLTIDFTVSTSSGDISCSMTNY
ncbi:MAG: hypothetical protein ACJATE_002107 [Bacteroidia bacterium]|jgi:hypothetical protein